MIDALVAGKLYAKPQPHTAKNGNTFATAKVRAAAGEEALFVNVIAFEAGVVSALLALDAGDSLALTGSATPKVWTAKDGTARPALDVVAAQVLTPYHVTRKRAAVGASTRQTED
ncbi:MAG: single-stranded DNA-binding protein [Burkholderiaceae bacterium]|nr:MAG: single-stranded DNA-binding protein [Burkholderiaceae bacterium]